MKQDNGIFIEIGLRRKVRQCWLAVLIFCGPATAKIDQGANGPPDARSLLKPKFVENARKIVSLGQKYRKIGEMLHGIERFTEDAPNKFQLSCRIDENLTFSAVLR